MPVEAPLKFTTLSSDILIQPDLGGTNKPISPFDETIIIVRPYDRILPSAGSENKDFLPAADLNIETYQQQVTSIERKAGFGYNVLAEVGILLQSLQGSPDAVVGQQAKDYVLENEMTAACEAVSDKSYIWSSYRPWDSKRKEFQAFGTSFINMLRAGVLDMQDKVKQQHLSQYTIELNRRTAELATEEWLTNSYQEGKIDNQIFLTISPYPEEISEEVAMALGYKPEEHLAKLRFEVFVNKVRQTLELCVGRGSVRIFQRLIEDLGYSSSDFQDSTSFLNTPLLMGSSANDLDTIMGLVQSYDALLEDQDKASYFCGQLARNGSEKDYEKIVERQRGMREKGQGLVTGIYNLDLELAKSLSTGEATSAVVEILNYWLTAKDQQGVTLLDEEQLDFLRQAASSGILSRDAAFILKKNELVRMWSIMACVLNEEKATELFGREQVILIQKMVESATITRPQVINFIDQVIAQAKPQFDPCPGGGSIGASGSRMGGSSVFSSSLSTVRQTLFGGSTESRSKILCCTCPFCKQQVEAKIENGTISCPKCGREAPYKD